MSAIKTSTCRSTCIRLLSHLSIPIPTHRLNIGTLESRNPYRRQPSTPPSSIIPFNLQYYLPSSRAPYSPDPLLSSHGNLAIAIVLLSHNPTDLTSLALPPPPPSSNPYHKHNAHIPSPPYTPPPLFILRPENSLQHQTFQFKKNSSAKKYTRICS